jgi:hypothetical protein
MKVCTPSALVASKRVASRFPRAVALAGISTRFDVLKHRLRFAYAACQPSAYALLIYPFRLCGSHYVASRELLGLPTLGTQQNEGNAVSNGGNITTGSVPVDSRTATAIHFTLDRV